MSHAITLLPRNDWDWTCWTRPWHLPSCRGAVDRSGATVGFIRIVHGNYLIVYRLSEAEKTVEILRFWHAARGEPRL